MRYALTAGMALAVFLSGLAHAQTPEAAGRANPPALAAQPVAPVTSEPAKAAVTTRRGLEAKEIFGAMASAAPLTARAIGFYSRGCLAGAKPLAIDGDNWQAMRLSRNRNWGHPKLIALIERLAGDAARLDGWPGLLVGDLSQPRGGPMLTGHASHQIGLDADIWLTPMPERRLTEAEREELPATSMLGADRVLVDPAVWTAAHARLILRAASYPEVERVLVHPGIKKALCAHPGADPRALGKVRPYWGHHYHMHIRIACPKDSPGCEPQPPVPADNGCGKEVDDWIALLRRPPKPVDPKAKPPPPKPGLTIADLPAECRLVVEAGEPQTTAEAEARAKLSRTAASRR